MIRSKFDAFLRAFCETVVVAFAVWTLLSHAVTLTDNSFDILYRLAFLPVLAAAGWLGWLIWRRARQEPEIENAPHQQPSTRLAEPQVLAVLLAAAGLSAVFAGFGEYRVFWLLTLPFLAWSYLRQLDKQTLQFDPPGRSAWNRAAFFAAAAVALAATLLINRPNPDQTLAIHMAVSVLDRPAGPIFAEDSLHAIPGANYLPTYRVHTFELLAAFLTRLLGIREPIYVFQLGLAPFFALFCISSGALLLQKLTPRRWGLAALLLTAVLLLFRDSYWMYGNFAYVRMFEGKSVFVTGLVPLLAVFAIEMFERPTLHKWLLVTLAQVAAVGMTANALYAAPLATGLAFAAHWRPTWTSTRRLVLGLSTSVYPLLLALLIRSAIHRDGLGLSDFEALMPIDEATRLVLGEGSLLWLWLVALIAAWAAPDLRPSRTWMLGVSLVFTGLCLNPMLDQYWGTYVTANYLTWRLFWCIPLPVFLAVYLTEGLAAVGGRKLVFAFTVLSLIVVAITGAPWIDTLVRPGITPGLKVPQPDYAVAQRLNQIAGEGNPVLAPENISAWVPTFRHHAYPLVAREHYTMALLTVFENRIDTRDLRDRLALAAYLNGGSQNNTRSETLLARWLEEDRISAVAVPVQFARREEIAALLRAAGFDMETFSGYELFHR